MDLPDEDEELDLILRHVTGRFPEQLARALLPAGSVVTSAKPLETQATSRQRRIDRGILVVVDGELEADLTEWQLEMTANVPFRMYEYHTLTALALAGEAGQAKTKPPRIRSTLVLLSGREKPWPEEGEYRTSPAGASFSGVTFRIEAVYQRTVAELTAKGPLWSIFAPLAVDADAERMKAVLERLRAEMPAGDFEELAVGIVVMADQDRRRRGLRGAIVGVLGKEVVMQSWVWTESRKQGREEGEKQGREQTEQRTIARLFEKRLGRPLSDEQRSTLFRRLGTLGYDRLADLRDDLSAEALAAWLDQPDDA